MNWSSTVIPGNNIIPLNNRYYLFYNLDRPHILNGETNTLIDITTYTGEYGLLINTEHHLQLSDHSASIVIIDKWMYLIKYDLEYKPTGIGWSMSTQCHRITIAITRYNISDDLIKETNFRKIVIANEANCDLILMGPLLRTPLENTFISQVRNQNLPYGVLIINLNKMEYIFLDGIIKMPNIAPHPQ